MMTTLYFYVTYNSLFYSLVMYRYWGESVFVMSLILDERDEMNRLCLMRGTWPLWRNLGMDIFLSHGPQLSLLLLLFSTHKLKIKVHIRMVSRWSDQKFIVRVVCFVPFIQSESLFCIINHTIMNLNLLLIRWKVVRWRWAKYVNWKLVSIRHV